MPQLKTLQYLLIAFNIKSKSSACLIRPHSVWLLAASLISCPAILLHHYIPGTRLFLLLHISNMLGPQSLAFLFPLPLPLPLLFTRYFTFLHIILVSVQMHLIKTALLKSTLLDPCSIFLFIFLSII